MKTQKVIFIIVTFFIASVSYADTIRLLDNSLVTGKIISHQGDNIVFANTKGTFKVQKKFIKKMFRTNSPEEDIEIYRNTGNMRNSDNIRSDYAAGLEKKNRLSKILEDDQDIDIELAKEKNKKRYKSKKNKEGYYGDWIYGRLSFTMIYFSTLLSEFSVTKNSNEVLPSGIEAVLGYDQGLEFKKTSMYIPGLRITHTYFYFTQSLFKNDVKEIQGHEINLGLVWALPGLNSKVGYFSVFFLPGASLIFIHNRKSHKFVKTATFSLHCGMGYEVRVHEKVFIHFRFNYNYLIDTLVSFNSIGGSFGASFKLW